jgi:hypothetical protein
MPAIVAVHQAPRAVWTDGRRDMDSPSNLEAFQLGRRFVEGAGEDLARTGKQAVALQ